MKSILFFAFFFCTLIFGQGFAQSLNYNDPLPVDQTIKKGVLPNGLTYYIKSTDVVKGAASYYIIQNVGSILENENQRGLAHFLEHMAFNGTEHFPGKGILNTLQKQGAVFGKDINAYTSFDETVYNLSNIPTQNRLLDTCLMVLKDWSNYLLLTNEEIDAERGVIKEEWRARQSGRMRLFEKSMPVTFNHSKYADRMPIGLMSVVEHFDYKLLRDFYHDWYRTDLQAIAVIGDVEVAEVEQKIIQGFSEIPAIKNPKERFIVDIPDNEELAYVLGTDPEVSTASISFSIRHKKSTNDQTVKELKRSLLESIVSRILSARLSEASKKPDANFLAAKVEYNQFTRTTDVFKMSIYPKPNKQKEAFKEVVTAVVKAVKFGFTQPEIERAAVQTKSFYENAIAQREDASHRQIVYHIQNDYLNNITATDIEKEYEIAENILNKVTAEELHNTLIRLYAKRNRSLNVTGVEGNDNLTETEARQFIEAIENSTNLEPYTEDMEGKTLLSNVSVQEGAIVRTSQNLETGATSYILSNGIKLHYKFVDKEKDKVFFKAVSQGGTSLLKDEDLPSASMVVLLGSMSGLGDYNATDLQKLLAGKTANVSIELGDITESMSGSSNTKDVETMLQMVHLHFVKPRFDPDAYKVLESNIDNYIVRRSKDIGEKMKDSLMVNIYGRNNPKQRIFNKKYVKHISFDKIKDIYSERFADASDFEFFIVGDVRESQLVPLLEKYVAGIPTKNKVETFEDNSSQWISDHIDKDIYLTMEDPKATVKITYKKEMPYSRSNSIYTKALGDMLQLRVLETVREEEGGAYSPRAMANFQREPKSQAVVFFSFDCNPDLADKMVDIVHNEIKKISKGIMSEVDLNKTRTNFIKERDQAKNNTAYDMNLLTSYFRYNENMNDPKNFEKIVNNMTKKDIQHIADQILNGGKSYEIVFKPKP